MLARHDWTRLSAPQRAALLRRPAQHDPAGLERSVAAIIAAVRSRGDAALADYTRRFDGVLPETLEVGAGEFAAAEAALPPAAGAAIERAIANVRRFHEAQRPQPLALDTAPGVRCERLEVPIASVGLYVPAGPAPRPSATIMTAVPAALAGCPTRVLCTPPRPDGGADPAVLVAARRCGV